MLKANELRIGNLVKYDNCVKVIDVINDSKNIVEFEDGDTVYAVFHCQPIPLTEEWLLKFGFVEHESVAGFELSFGRQSFIVANAQDDDFLLLYRSDVGCNYHDLCFVETIHSLQNIIYSLTGEELEVK
jgi:hypothetical protein